MVKCPRCNLDVPGLNAVDANLNEKLQQAGIDSVPSEVCSQCLLELQRSTVKSGSGFLVAQEKAKEEHRANLWKSRVQLIKRGRGQMSVKNYSEAAVAYEKYLKILELVFGCKKGEKITPEQFKDNARTSELTVVTSVYWDLLRIYDSSEKYADRQQIVAKQLANFVRYTPIFPDIMKRASAFQRQAKNPAVIKQFLREAAEQRPRCFIATSAFESPLAWEVQMLRHYRDFTLRKSRIGQIAIKFYDTISPSIAAFLDFTPSLKPLIRALLRILVRTIS